MIDNPGLLHRDAFVADMHCDAVLQIQRGYDIGVHHDGYHVDIPRLRDGGIDLLVLASGINPFEPVEHPFEAVDRQVGILRKTIKDRPQELKLCLTAADALEAKKNGQTGVLLAIEGGNALESDPAKLAYFYAKGVRLVTIAHERPTGWCQGWHEKETSFNGLTDVGREMIREMNRLGIIIDLSHSGPSAVDAVLELSAAPVVASHSSARALCDYERNISDRHLRGIADGGGVVAVTFVSSFLTLDFHRALKAFWEPHEDIERELRSLFVSELDEPEKQRRFERHRTLLDECEKQVAPLRPTVATVVDHIDYMVAQVGADHVALGSDFDGMTVPPVGLEDCSGYPHITEELSRRGYAETDIRRILGGNFLRVLQRVCG